MENTLTLLHLIKAAVFALLIVSIAVGDNSAAPSVVTKYVNHTVGGTDGWFFNAKTNATSADYNKWAASDTFSLGDYLIFNTNSNQTVIQTTNKASYKSCSMEDDTSQFYGGNVEYNVPATVAVPLTTTGPNYYFSDASDGEQCRHGLAFMINVGRGLGLPPSLNHPPPPAYVEPPSPSEDMSPPALVNSTTPSSDDGAGTVVEVHWMVVCLVVCVGGLIAI